MRPDPDDDNRGEAGGWLHPQILAISPTLVFAMATIESRHQKRADIRHMITNLPGQEMGYITSGGSKPLPAALPTP